MTGQTCCAEVPTFNHNPSFEAEDSSAKVALDSNEPCFDLPPIVGNSAALRRVLRMMRPKTNNIAEPHAEVYDRTPVLLITRNAFARQSEAQRTEIVRKIGWNCFWPTLIYPLNALALGFVAGRCSRRRLVILSHGEDLTRSRESEQGDSDDSRKHDVMQHVTTFSSIQAVHSRKAQDICVVAAQFENIQAAVNLSSNQIG